MVCNGNLIAPICQNIDLAISRGRNCPPMGSLRFGKVLPYRREGEPATDSNCELSFCHTSSLSTAGHECAIQTDSHCAYNCARMMFSSRHKDYKRLNPPDDEPIADDVQGGRINSWNTFSIVISGLY